MRFVADRRNPCSPTLTHCQLRPPPVVRSVFFQESCRSPFDDLVARFDFGDNGKRAANLVVVITLSTYNATAVTVTCSAAEYRYRLSRSKH